jgi:hypothetical protein
MMPARPGVTKANFDRIEVGMSQAAVSEIFGKEFSLFSGLAGGTKHDFYARVYWFHEDCASAKIEFHNDSVVVMTWTESTETIPDKLRRWLHLPK